ncbi:GldL-related protein [Lacinutrix jangbogonensis]
MSALFKIQHGPYGSEILMLGLIFEVIGLLVVMVILIKYFLKK